jgi:transmembrane sensor
MGSHRQIEKSAAAWLVRRDREEWSKADEAEFQTWLSASTAHRLAFIRLQAAWEHAGRLKVLAAGMSSGHALISGDRSAMLKSATSQPRVSRNEDSETRMEAVPEDLRRFRTPVRRVMGVAAAAAFLAATLVVWIAWPNQGTSYRTAIGGMAAISMNDGSTVTLNTNSDIRVALSKTERRVDLEQGEAFFEVAKDPNRPFVVRVGDQRVIAVGTKFSVRRDSNHVRVIVTEGRVRVEHSDLQHPAEVALVSAGGVAVAGVAGVLVQDKSLSDAEERVSWRDGIVVFRETPLSEAVAEFNRYNTRQIYLDDPALGSMRIGGHFRTRNSEGFVRLLADAFPIRVEEDEGRIVLHHQ